MTSKRCPECGLVDSYGVGAMAVCAGCGEMLAETWALQNAVTDIMDEQPWIAAIREHQPQAAADRSAREGPPGLISPDHSAPPIDLGAPAASEPLRLVLPPPTQAPSTRATPPPVEAAVSGPPGEQSSSLPRFDPRESPLSALFPAGLAVPTLHERPYSSAPQLARSEPNEPRPAPNRAAARPRAGSAAISPPARPLVFFGPAFWCAVCFSGLVFTALRIWLQS